ncbi:hypothetical protein [Tannerella forsythia]|uniref:hypothetical protein n=1 Tax=Tannerella forsythia TaxID=28112 RepID=UPI000869B2E5|nr:hypothetical protein [Tannerella forsythia]SCQ25406.1 hypothetical protein TFUB22_02710 [Tannerella forsythia]
MLIYGLPTRFNTDPKFTLVRDEIIDTESESVELRSSGNGLSPFEASTPIHVYYYHGGEKSDHYFGTEAPNQPLIINGRHYLHMCQDFNLASENIWNAQPLYRYYSEAYNDHLLSTEPSVQGYKQEAHLGYIYPSMQIGAVPLKEYYSAEKKNHFYKVWNDPDKEKDYVFQRNIGYVYYGRPNPWKQADVITAKIERMDSPRIITFNLKVKDGNNRYRNLSYSETFNSGSQYIENESSSITLPNSYVIVSMDIVVKSKEEDIAPTVFKNMERPDHVLGWINNKTFWRKNNGIVKHI